MERTTAILATVPDGIVTVDPSGVISMVNNQIERMFGYAPSELEGYASARAHVVGNGPVIDDNY